MINNVLFASKVGYPISEGVESPIVIPSQESKGVSFHMSPHSNPSEPLSPVRRLSLESGPSQLEDFHVEGLTPSKMATIQSVLGVECSENDIQMGKDSARSLDKVYSRRKNKTLSDILKLS